VFGVVFKLFIVEKELLAGRKNKLGAAVDTLQDAIGEFHASLPRRESHTDSNHGLIKNLPVAVPCPLSGRTTRARTAFKDWRFSNTCPEFRAAKNLHARCVLSNHFALVWFPRRARHCAAMPGGWGKQHHR
jgi:hypothetical protein